MEEKIINGDCIEGMNKLDEGAFNLVIADPPYNLSKDFGVYKEDEKRPNGKIGRVNGSHLRTVCFQIKEIYLFTEFIIISAGFNALCTSLDMSTDAR